MINNLTIDDLLKLQEENPELFKKIIKQVEKYLKGGDKVKVLWLSRHPLSDEARKELEEKYGAIEVKQVNATFPTHNTIEYVRELAKGYDLIGGVFPAQFWGELINLLLRKRVSIKELIGAPLFIVISAPVSAEERELRKFSFSHIIYLEEGI